MLGLRPHEFYHLTPLELWKMIDAHEEAELARRYETAYWIANLMNTQVRKKIRVDHLMAPFIRKKTKAEKVDERDAFFASFKKQQEEAAHGDHS